MAKFWTVDVDAVEVYVKYFDVALIPATVFFWNSQHIKVDYGWYGGVAVHDPCRGHGVQ